MKLLRPLRMNQGRWVFPPACWWGPSGQGGSLSVLGGADVTIPRTTMSDRQHPLDSRSVNHVCRQRLFHPDLVALTLASKDLDAPPPPLWRPALIPTCPIAAG